MRSMQHARSSTLYLHGGKGLSIRGAEFMPTFRQACRAIGKPFYKRRPRPATGRVDSEPWRFSKGREHSLSSFATWLIRVATG
jgi:hypothetical protein